MVWATVIVSILSTVVNSYYSERLIHYGFRKQLRDLAPYIGASLAMVCAGWAVMRNLHAGPVIQLIVTIAACIACYAAWCRWCKPGEMKTLLDLLIRGSARTDSACIPCHNIIESTEQPTL